VTIAIDAHELNSEINVGARRDLWSHPEIAIRIVIADLSRMKRRKGLKREKDLHCGCFPEGHMPHSNI
jgi:hypothetical protein